MEGEGKNWAALRAATRKGRRPLLLGSSEWLVWFLACSETTLEWSQFLSLTLHKAC